jgi:SAM-dependent methyltransferase
MTARKDALLAKINLKKGMGLEIGPLCWPLVRKGEANIKYVDHVSTAELKKIYKGDAGVDLDLIVDVDYPLKGKSLEKAIGTDGPFDYLIASHVIEHVPDMVRWLQDLAAVLKVGGILSLAIPDKRFTFDIDRDPSSPGDIVGAYLDRYTRPSSAMLFDYAARYRMNIDAKKVWDGELYLSSKAPHRYSLHQAAELCIESKEHYVDNHCFVFTPYSFFEVIRTLMELELIDFKVASFFTTEEGTYEFLVSLQKIDVKMMRQERLQSLPEIPRDLYGRELEAKVKQLEGSMQDLKQALEQRQSELQHVLQSKSWRLTRPVRYGIRIAKKAKRK